MPSWGVKSWEERKFDTENVNTSVQSLLKRLANRPSGGKKLANQTDHARQFIQADQTDVHIAFASAAKVGHIDTNAFDVVLDYF